MLGNRDEMAGRPTKPLHRWPGTSILGGRDDDKGGTWTALNAETGRLAFVTNYREPLIQGRVVKSRGECVVEYVTCQNNDASFFVPDGDLYGGFNFIGIDMKRVLRKRTGLASCFYLTNRGVSNPKCDQPEALPAGRAYVLSNSTLQEGSKTWAKVRQGEQVFNKVFSNDQSSPFVTAGSDVREICRALVERVLASETSCSAPGDPLPQTGMPRELEQHLASIKIKPFDFTSVPGLSDGKMQKPSASASTNALPSTVYGTCSSYVILVDHQGHGVFYEHSWLDPQGYSLGKDVFIEFEVKF